MCTTRGSRLLPFCVAVAVALLLSPALFGHGASKGLHLHVLTEPAKPGGPVRVQINAAEPIVSFRIGFVDGEPLAVELKRPKRNKRVRVILPEVVEGATASLHAEAVTGSGKTVRASAVVRVEKGTSV